MTKLSSSSLCIEDLTGVLQEIHAQVALERAKRIQLEAQIAQARTRNPLSKEQATIRSSSSGRCQRSSRDSLAAGGLEWTALEAQVAGYRQLVEVLTKERPAIAAAMLREKQRSNGLLPLKFVRLLELIPWHPHVQERVTVQDAVYEWQHYDRGRHDWRGDLQSFPDFFHALPTTATSSPGPETHADSLWVDGDDQSSTSSGEETSVSERRTSLTAGTPANTAVTTSRDFPSFLAGLLASRNIKGKPSRQEELVLTNANLTQRFVLNAKEGYPLPDPTISGTWRWIGRWTIDRPKVDDGPEQLVPKPQQPLHRAILTFFDRQDDDAEVVDELCDGEGWTYAKEASHFVLCNAKELCWGNADALCSCPDMDNAYSKEAAAIATICLQCRHRRKPVLRRRKWTRQRVLVDYPLASESSRQYLRMAADNASAKLATQELAERFQKVATANGRVQDHWETVRKANQGQLERFQSTWEHHEERIKSLRYGKFKRKVEELACNQDDILPIIANPDLFTQLQKSLRQSGAITNAMLQQGIHFYILDHVRPIHGKSRRRKASYDASDGTTRRHNSLRPRTSE